MDKVSEKHKKNKKTFKDLGNHNPKECNHRLNTIPIHQKKKNALEGKNLVQLVTNDIVRDMLVPNRNPIDMPGIWKKTEFKRLQNQAHVVTLEDKQVMIEEIERKKMEEIQASEMRKDALSKAQIIQHTQIDSELANVENEAKNKSEYLLQRSHELLNEQDDRVKVANRVILATKCRAIRNAQINEKELIKKQLHQESRRLDDLMEQERQRLLREDEHKEELEEQKNKRYGKEIQQQIRDNEIEKLLYSEKIEEESRMLNKALIAMRKEEEEKLKERKLNQTKLREELKRVNLDLEKYKVVQKEEQRIADLRIQEFMKQKALREEQRKNELKLIKLAKEKEIARLRAQQEQAQDKQSFMDEINAIRIQEEVERAWREKERLNAIKKAEELQALQNARNQQINDIRKAQAIAIARDEAEFQRVVQVQTELFNKDKQKKAEKRSYNIKHRKELLRQINDKERERINQMKEKFEDGKAFRLNQAIRDNQIEKYITNKVDKLRQEPIPEQYVADIERQLKITK